MKTIKNIFDEISAEPGTNKKMEILAKHAKGSDAELLKRVLYLANSKRIKFYIKQIPDYITTPIDSFLEYVPLSTALVQLEILSSRKKTGQDAIDHLSNILSSVSKDDSYIIERIIEKDCKIGMGTTNMNKVFLGLIENTPYMGAKAFKKELAEAIFNDPKNVGYAYSNTKMDGRYLNAIIRSGEVDLESRGGESTNVEGAAFIEELKKFPDCVLNSELTIPGISRYDSNGIIASLVSIGGKKKNGEDVREEIKKLELKRGMTYQQALDSIVMTVWDTITVDEYFAEKSNTPYHDRLVNLSKILKSTDTKKVQFIDSKKVYSFAEAMQHFQDQINLGNEGTILKASMGIWKDGKPNHQIKFKKEMNLDLKIVGFNYGTGKNVQVISSLNVESSDGLLKTKPTGINEELMSYITSNQSELLGKIVEIKCSGISHDSQKNYSTLHPVFKMIRDDKNIANSLEECLEIDKSSFI